MMSRVDHLYCIRANALEFVDTPHIMQDLGNRFYNYCQGLGMEEILYINEVDVYRLDSLAAKVLGILNHE